VSRNTVAAAIAIVVTIIWVLAIVGSAIRRDYTALSLITPIMATVAGWLYYRKKNGDGSN
jgi:ATP/ADP translocase